MTGLSRKQAAELAGVSTHTIAYWTRRGLLPSPRQGFAQTLTAEELFAAQAAVHVGEVIPRWRADPVHAGHRLRSFREVTGQTQLALAAQADLTHEAISILEHGKRPPQAPTVRKLSRALGIAPIQFVDDTPIGPKTLSTLEAGLRLDVPVSRIQTWLQEGVLPGRKVSGRWRIPAEAVFDLDRSGRLRGRSRRLDG